MKLIDRYIFKICSKNLLLVLSFLVGLVVVQSIYSHFLDLLKADFGFLDIIEFISLCIVENLPSVMPIAFFISLIFTISSLQKTKQFIILKSTGQSLLRICLPFWILAILISATIFSLSLYVSPISSELKNLFIEGYRIKNSDEINNKSILAYENKKNNRIWFIEGFDENNFTGSYTILHQMGKDYKESSRIVAERSYYDKNLETWSFENGSEIIFNIETGDPLILKKFKNRQITYLDENPNDILLFKKNVNNLTFNEIKKILNILDFDDIKRSKYLFAYYGILESFLLPFIFVGITAPLLTRQIRGNYFVFASYPILVLFSFFILKGFFYTLGQNNFTPVYISVFFPFVLYIVFILKLYWKT